jgi:hypothetical protein
VTVATDKVQNRRELHFAKIDDILAEAERLNGVPVKTLGNWSGGQILRHLSIPMNGCIDGISFSAPWYMRLVGRYVLKGYILKHGMKAGFKLGESAAAVLVPPETSWEEGLDALRKGIHRLHSEERRCPHPILGPFTRAEWDAVHCRHAELHLSFLIPEA